MHTLYNVYAIKFKNSEVVEDVNIADAALVQRTLLGMSPLPVGVTPSSALRLTPWLHGDNLHFSLLKLFSVGTQSLIYVTLD